MKKLIYLLFLLPLAIFSSCNNDDDLPNVDLKLTLSGVAQNPSNSQFVIEQGQPATIDGLTAVNSSSNKPASVVNIRYFIDGVMLFGTEEAPFSGVIPTEYLSAGVHYINIDATILQVDKSIAFGHIQVPITVVDSEEGLPSEIGTYSIVMSMKK